MTERKRLFSPQFDGPLAGWAYNYSIANVWRVLPDMDMDDMMAEAMLVFVQCKRRYVRQSSTVRNERHFAALFRSAFTNRIHRHAARRAKRIGIAESRIAVRTVKGDAVESSLFGYFAASGSDDRAALTSLVREAPKLVRRVVKALIPPEGYYKSESDIPEKRPRESWNDFLCRIAGADPQQVDLVELTVNWLYGELA